MLKKSVKFCEVEAFCGTNVLPSFALNPVSIGTRWKAPLFQAVIGAMGIIPPRPSITGWKGQRTEGLYLSNIAPEADFISEEDRLRRAGSICEVGSEGMRRKWRNSWNWVSWRGLDGV